MLLRALEGCARGEFTLSSAGGGADAGATTQEIGTTPDAGIRFWSDEASISGAAARQAAR
jgi:hypothetical protein